ncbi:MAG: hypothetical protein C4K58_06125 [Flavobacteriaceae bacterium]|nr:MAG: hypothetical protein C4K58_06125 [Flavobacteriaceae bacterium]
MINYKELTKSLLATVFILLGVSLLFFVLFKLKSILVYIVVSVVVSLLCRPMYQLGFKLTKSSGFSAIFSLTIFFGLFALFFLLMVPLIRQQAENLSLLDTHLIREKAMSQLNFFNAYLLQMDIHFLDDYLKSGKGFDLQLSKISHYILTKHSSFPSRTSKNWLFLTIRYKNTSICLMLPF